MATWALAIAFLVHLVTAAIAAEGSRLPHYDFDRYYQIAAGAGVPYRDYQVEHPPGALLVLRTLAAIPGGRTAFGIAVVLVNLVADVAILLALAWGWGIAAALYWAIVVIPVLDLLVNRMDLWSTAATTIALAAWRLDRPVVTGVALGAGGAFKLWPLPFGVLLAWHAVKGRSAKPLAVFAAVVAIVIGIWWAIARTEGIYQVLTFRGASGWQIESTVGSLIHLAGETSAREESGALRIGHLSGVTSTLMFAMAMPVFAWSVWRGARSGHLGAGWLAGVSTLLLVSALLSAQFIGWLIPGAAIAWADGDRRPALLTAAAVCLTELFWKMYVHVMAGVMFPLMLVVARNVCLAAIAATAVMALIAAPTSYGRLRPEADA